MELTIFDKAFMVKEKMLQRNLAGEVSTQDPNTCFCSGVLQLFLNSELEVRKNSNVTATI